ncbi:MAG: peptide chain release factor N(5)-glutamine methyltransferase [Methylococcaceae bacterium]
MHSIKSALAEGAGALQYVSDSPILDAEVLLCTVINKGRSFLRAWPDQLLTAEHINRFLELLEERKKGVPIAYITNNREFWSRDFHVTPDVLIPRPDTELLIELSLQLTPRNQPVDIIDLGTGSGIIAITLALECPKARISAVDASLAALKVAQRNANKHLVSTIQFYQSDWFASVLPGKFDLVISNPPYIAEHDRHLQEGDLRFEPSSALISAQDGLKDITMIAAAARSYLKPDGYLLIEHGYNQQYSVQAIFEQFGYGAIKTHIDLSAQPRATSGQGRSS